MENWAMYLFQYIVGGLVFFFGIGLSIRAGEVRLDDPGERKYIIVLVLGLCAYALVHGVWNYLALYS